MKMHPFVSLVFAGLLLSPGFPAAAEAVPQNLMTVSLQEMPPEQRGDLLMARQQYLAAIDAYRQAPMSAVIWNKLGIAYHHMLAMEQAKVDYERALFIKPDYPEAINNLGAVDFAEGNYKKAIRLYERALKLMPHSAVIAANLGTAYFARGKFRQGYAAYQTAFRLDPNVFGLDSHQIISGPTDSHQRAREDYCLAELFAESGNQKNAIEYLRKAFNEGFSDMRRLMEDNVFAQLRKTSDFAQLMAEQKPH